MLTEEQIKNYENLSIRKLPEEIRKNGYLYRQVKRTITKFLYSQHLPDGSIVAYEVFFNRLGDLRRAKQRWATLQHRESNPEDHEQFYESFPSDEDFGRRAWTYPTLEKAMVAFESK